MTTSHSLVDLISDAEQITTLPLPEQERTITALRNELEALKMKFFQMQSGSGESAAGQSFGQASFRNPMEAQTAQTVFSAYNTARQACPHCRAAQLAMPSVPPSFVPTPPMLPPVPTMPPTSMMNGIQSGMLGLFDHNLAATALAGTALVKGATGNDVMRLQMLLRAAGHNIKADGVFGAKTEAALIKFQQSRGLRGDGIYKEADAQALEQAAGEKSGATARANAQAALQPTSTAKSPVPQDQTQQTLLQTGLRIGVPLVAGSAAAVGAWHGLKETNKQKKGAYTAAIGFGTAMVTYIGTNILADSLTNVKELVV